ncbi:hypothetical protein XENOCAPTIV_006868, partial [Xenoophorus captivus]
SHDSFTFWVDVHAPVGPDQKAYVKYLATMFSVLAKKVMVKWSMTQNLTFREQLDAGIRYFDLRVSSKPSEPGSEIYFIHGLFGHKVVFLDFNHYYAMDAEHHVYLIHMLQQVIVFYHHPSAQGIPVMWPGNKIPAPWANTTEPNKLIQTQRPGKDGVNIITSDFVELTDFANIVIKLNNVLLSESECKPR